MEWWTEVPSATEWCIFTLYFTPYRICLTMKNNYTFILLQICRRHHPYGRKQRRTKEPLDEHERGQWKSWLKTHIHKTKIMVSGPITSWHIDGEKWKQWQTIFLGSQITADGDCSHEIKRRLLLGRKDMTNLDSILKAETLLFQQRSV